MYDKVGCGAAGDVCRFVDTLALLMVYHIVGCGAAGEGVLCVVTLALLMVNDRVGCGAAGGMEQVSLTVPPTG